MAYLYEHPNFKYIVKNRKCPPLTKVYSTDHQYEFFIVRANGQKQRQYTGNKNGLYVFDDAGPNGHVYLNTYAGPIEIFEKDFK